MTTLAPEVMPHPQLSDGVIAYLGLGTATSPQRNIRALEAIARDDDLILATRTVINEVLKYDTDHIFDTDMVRHLVAEHTRTVCPALSPTAVEAIVWNYTVGWR